MFSTTGVGLCCCKHQKRNKPNTLTDSLLYALGLIIIINFPNVIHCKTQPCYNLLNQQRENMQSLCSVSGSKNSIKAGTCFLRALQSTRKTNALQIICQPTQERNLQTKYRAHIGFFDDVSGTYRNIVANQPAFKLSMKPWEWRNGQLFWYLKFAGIVVVTSGLVFAALVIVYFTFWFFHGNTYITSFNHSYNPHPFLEIRNGKDMSVRYDPLTKYCAYLSPYRSEDNAMLFFRELNAARSRKL